MDEYLKALQELRNAVMKWSTMAQKENEEGIRNGKALIDFVKGLNRLGVDIEPDFSEVDNEASREKIQEA